MLFTRLGAALVTVGLAAAALSGCSFDASTDGLSVSRTDLEKDITQRLQKAGEKPQTVTCKENLAGQVGRTTRCELLLSGADSFDVVVTATKVDGENISYSMIPAASKEQLDKLVAKTVSESAKVTVDSADCDGGLEGKQGAEAHCDVTAGGETTRQRVTVTKVEGLMMYFHVQPAPS
ncbi:DUF4333 domain-containing protein [Mycolicibacterium sp. P1-5]|uniref:DUF4333 domain-containing protein n=1 Tax=Mycolicibacterium sp. P1-5 TaxID=2024617 RepID=UPI0011ED82B9|nr:DUF4333 domain-containing protein [Mycolicibacterium sp. P1-5]KAA0111732.1 DUF4333 domain-containing protein [Mycolicibacterium sp. P1-5]